MELKDYLGALRERWYILVAAAILGALVAFVYSAMQPDLYESRTSAFVSSQRGDTVSELVQGSQYTQSQMQSYAELAQTPAVLQPVIDELGLDETVESLASQLTAEVRLNTVIVTVRAVNQDPAQAAIISDAVMDSLAEVVSDLSPRDGNGDASIALTTVAPASEARFPFAPNTRLMVATGAMLGLVLALVYALLKQAFDTRIRTSQDTERIGDIPFLGEVPRYGASLGARLRSPKQTSQRMDPWLSSPPAREAYRRVAASLDFADVDASLRMIVVSSASPGEGKTTTSVNLALALAERHARVLLIDADLRRPRVAEECGLDGAVGLTTVLIHQTSLAEAVQEWGTRGVHVLASGIQPPNPTALLNSEAMRDLLDEAREFYDFVVIDSAPLLPVSDTLTLSRLIGATMLVSRYNSTRRQSLARATEMLVSAGARLIGVVINAVPAQRRGSDYYGDAAAWTTSVVSDALPVDDEVTVAIVDDVVAVESHADLKDAVVTTVDDAEALDLSSADESPSEFADGEDHDSGADSDDHAGDDDSPSQGSAKPPRKGPGKAPGSDDSHP